MPPDSHAFDPADLQEAFHLFLSASQKLEQSYEKLKDQTQGLKKELSRKNARLVTSLREKKKLERFLERILQNLPVGILVTDAEGLVRLTNQKARNMLGKAAAELNGVHAGVLPLLRDLPLRPGSSREKREGRCVYRLSVSSLNRSNQVDSGWVVLIEDISEITRWKTLAERQKRLTSMGEMAARIAHEIRNPLGSMELNAAMLLEELEGTGASHTLACRLSAGVRTVSQTLTNLLHFAKGTDPQSEPLPSEELVSEALEFAWPMLQEKDIRVRGNFREASSLVVGDRVLLRQALLNLFLNAIEAMDPGGRLCIDVANEDEDAGEWEGQPVMKIFIRDNGKGITEENLDRIFDPFFSTKSRGTGLGLAIVNNIIESHGGIVEVESRVGEGSCFVLSLPCQSEDVEHEFSAHSCCG
jgi:signal transduction histidine kinase